MARVLSENRDKLDQLAALLVEREVIFREDLEEIYGKRPFEDENKTDNQPKGETTEITENKTTTENSDSEPIVENTNIANNPTNE